jgi:hypothetical protein
VAKDCETRKAELECEQALARLRREDPGAIEKRTRREQRREARSAFWKGRRKARKESREAEGGQSGTMRVFLFLGLPAVLALFVYSRSQTGSGKVLAVGLLTAVAAFSVGALLGFLFGIPRSVAKKADETTPATSDKAAPEAAAAAAQQFTPNTNLEEISDWLTKILVGVGLVQIHQVSGAIEDLANGLAPSLGSASTGFPVAVTLLISFSIVGFASAYLYTRLRLQSAFELAAAIKRAITEQQKTETSAIVLVQAQLSPGGDSRPTPIALTEALKAATPGVRAQAFFLARKQRQEKPDKEDSEKDREEFSRLSIPVFEALIDCDREGKYDHSRAELGYARLETTPRPDLPGAKAALDEAIRLRDPVEVSTTPGYELNRAYAMVKIEKELGTGPSTDAAVEAIYADLETGIRAGGTLKKKKRHAIEAWLTRYAGKSDDPLQQRAAALLKSVKTWGR